MQAGLGKRTRDTGEEYEEDLIIFGVSYSPSVSYSLSPKFLISLGFGSVYYRWQREELGSTLIRGKSYNTNESYGVNFGFDNIAIGMKYIIKNK